MRRRGSLVMGPVVAGGGAARVRKRTPQKRSTALVKTGHNHVKHTTSRGGDSNQHDGHREDGHTLGQHTAKGRVKPWGEMAPFDLRNGIGEL